jgi:hypothetical protein
MRNNLLILSLAALCTLFAGFGFAGAGTTMRISVPFDFYAGNQHLAAGDYVFEIGSGLAQPASVVTVRQKAGTGLCILLTQAGTDGNSTKLAFNKYGDKHFLSGVSIRGLKAGVQMLRLEKELRAQVEKDRNVLIIAQK